MQNINESVCLPTYVTNPFWEKKKKKRNREKDQFCNLMLRVLLTNKLSTRDMALHILDKIRQPLKDDKSINHIPIQKVLVI
jgi:hypothetical protein